MEGVLTLIPKPSTINPKPSNPTLKPNTLNTTLSPNPPPEVLNPKTHTPNPKPSAEVSAESSALKLECNFPGFHNRLSLIRERVFLVQSIFMKITTQMLWDGTFV